MGNGTPRKSIEELIDEDKEDESDGMKSQVLNDDDDDKWED
jgi:hypothetical protein